MEAISEVNCVHGTAKMAFWGAKTSVLWFYNRYRKS
jgi:hypothetical protein